MYNSIWYQNLQKPLLTPKSQIFVIVWGILYSLILISLLIYFFKRTEKNKKLGYIFFTVQMILNFIWPIVFFLFKNIGLAFIIAVLLFVFVLLNLIEFYKTSKIAGRIFIPYLLWVIFAIYLNYRFMVLN